MRTLALALSCVALAACGGATDDGSSARPQAPCSAATAAALTGPVALQGTSFVPSCAKVAVNSTVRFTNRDTMTHTVTADSGSFDSGFLDPGLSFDATFAGTGAVGIHCTLHLGMRMTMIVE